MARQRRQDDFTDSDYVSCPVGGDWWKCEDINYPTFIGCCSSDPCSGQMCPTEDLYPMGFGAVTSPIPDYPNHSCPYGGLWYTCADNPIAFQGCCESNPCNGQGCPSSDLRPAGVHTAVVAGTSTYTVPSSIATALQTTASSLSPTISATSSPASFKAVSQSNNTTAVAGGAAAIAVVLTAAAGLIFYYLMRRRRRKQPFHGSTSQKQDEFHQKTGRSRTSIHTINI